MSKQDKRYWLDDPRNVSKIFYALVTLCALLLLSDLFYDKHGHYSWDEWFGFYGLYGFFGSVFLVLTAKQLRRLLMRKEDYYDDE
jgi:hypothetical protein